MIALQSTVEGKEMKLKELEDKLKPLGYDIGGGWEYDHGCFDYKIDEEDGYTFLRLPFRAIDGELDQRGVTVQLGTPFLLNHKYQDGLDDNPDVFNGLFRMAYNSSINQFQEPVDKDSTVDEKYLPTAKSLVEELELTLLY
ncbi:YugN-like family protein [Halalkalibacter alkaliphilus]|uniref:YugN-like family protein n=1 Tax=Halalkalibacter alkaliphilus TaxID=2917993 RepID=A0A9X2I8D0_9BACI|nr:YugN-like family protein [Halalkalibacter alkaliphilus]MCL7749902.1 YugN-like family protein [Halalkalibacter alkaliphilus]